MSTSKISVVVDPPTDLKRMEFVQQVIDPQIAEFEGWFSAPERGDGRLAGFEREILRSYLWWATKEAPRG
jgi:hypothetical protein